MKIFTAILLTIIYSCKNSPSDNDVIKAAKMKVTEGLIAPATASFPGNDKILLHRDKGDSTFHVAGYVDSQNAFGANLRSVWNVHIWYIGGDYSDAKSWVQLLE